MEKVNRMARALDRLDVFATSQPGPMFPSPYSTTMSVFKQVKVKIFSGDEEFTCEITVAFDSRGLTLPEAQLKSVAEKRYGSSIRQYIQSKGGKRLPIGVQHTGGLHSASARSFKMQEVAKAIAKAEARAFYGPPISEPEPEPKDECETDKPEGTRNVDKFLKEQQDKLWNR